MRRVFAVLAFLTGMGGGWQGKGDTWRPTDRLLSAVCYVESSNGRYTFGDEGRSLGDFQLSEAAWEDVSSWRRSRGLRVYKYHRHVFNAAVNRAYAANYLTLLHQQLATKLGRSPSVAQLYAAYNMGLSSFAACDYQISRINPATARKCRQVKEIVENR